MRARCVVCEHLSRRCVWCCVNFYCFFLWTQTFNFRPRRARVVEMCCSASLSARAHTWHNNVAFMHIDHSACTRHKSCDINCSPRAASLIIIHRAVAAPAHGSTPHTNSQMMLDYISFWVMRLITPVHTHVWPLFFYLFCALMLTI